MPDSLISDPHEDLKDALRRIPAFTRFRATDVAWLHSIVDCMPAADARRTAVWLRTTPKNGLAYESVSDIAFRLETFLNQLTPQGRAVVTLNRTTMLRADAMGAARAAILRMDDAKAARAEQWLASGIERGLLRHPYNYASDRPLRELHELAALFCATKAFAGIGERMLVCAARFEDIVTAFADDLMRRVAETSLGISVYENMCASKVMGFLMQCVVHANDARPPNDRRTRTSSPPPPEPPSAHRNDYATLGLPEGTPFPKVTRRFRTLSKRCHPDKGGDPLAYLAMACAYERIKSNS